MMHIIGTSGNSVKISILGYQFPENEIEKYDSNWLFIEVDVTHQNGSWIAKNACLLTWEVNRLADWFEALANNSKIDNQETFIEPELEFHLVDISSQSNLRIYFEYNLKPQWAPTGKGHRRDLYLDFPLSELDIRQMANNLREELSIYPQRALD